MEAALENGNLVEVVSLLETMINSSSPEDLERCKFLAEQTVNDLPIVHYLAQLTFQEDDIPRLDKLIKILTDFGYNINKTMDSDQALGFTALMASIDCKNLILMESLLRQGARMDIRDRHGYSPCQWAIIKRDLKCLEKLIQFGGPSVLATTSIEKNGNAFIMPVLHTATKFGNKEIVSYLLSNWEEFGLDVNEELFYKDTGSGNLTKFKVTPLECAVSKGDIPALQVLLQHPGIKGRGLDEVYLSLQEGHTEIALILLDYVSDEQFASDDYALNFLHPSAFQSGNRGEFTKKLILEYVRRGWNLNSLSGIPIIRQAMRMTQVWGHLAMSHTTRCTLLHLACFHKGEKEVIEFLVEAGADINIKTEWLLELTPLQISLALKTWRSAAYLIDKGADLGVRGSFKGNIPFTMVMRKNLTLGNLEPSSSLNAVELLVRMGSEEGLPLLDKVLARSDVVWHGADEFHLAVEGGNPVYVSKVLQHCAKLIPKDELSWVTFWKRDGNGWISQTVPTLVFLLSNLTTLNGLVNVPALADLIRLLVSFGYNLNLCCPQSDKLSDRTIYHILLVDFFQNSTLLLRTVLQVDHFQLTYAMKPAEITMHLLSRLCSLDRRNCWRDKPLPSSGVEAIKLLVTHGMDVTGMVVDAYFGYHFGYNVMLKMLYCAGATISEEFFASPQICHPDHPETQTFLQEIAEVKQWKDEFDRKERCSLKHLCRLRVRKMLKCVGDLKMLDGLPEELKDYVLCKV